MKVHAVLPMYNDPLLCELYFRNYAKYKNQYIHKLYIVLSPFDIIHGENIAEYEARNKIVRDHTIDDFVLTHRIHDERTKQHEHKNALLVKLLEELGIYNYEFVNFNGPLHNHMIVAGIQAARNDDAHIVIEEQDAYWLNDNYKQYLDMLQHLDIVGIQQASHQNIDVAKFNKKFNRTWCSSDYFPTLSLPEFLSNRIVSHIEKLIPLSGPIQAKEMQLDDVLKAGDGDTYLYFDTFQHINLELYKKTDNIKIDEFGETTPRIDVENNNPAIGTQYDDKILYHSGESRLLAYANLSIEHSKEKAYNLLQEYAVTPPHLKNSIVERVKDLRCCFYYQSLSSLHSLFNKNSYVSNFNHLGELVNFYKYDCSQLIKKIL